MEGIEKLREWRKNNAAADGAVRIIANQAQLETRKLDEICDDIQAEVDSKYVPLPVDADGVPIRIGDELCLSKLTRGEVSALMLTPDGWEWELEGDGWFDIRFTIHVKPDPVKELLEELIERAYTIEKVDSAPHPVVDECDIDEIAARIREAVEK